jgi:hypothetical protein
VSQNAKEDTPAQALTLDHVGAIARDLERAAQRWERLGFRLSPLSRQQGAVPGRAGVHPWATANRCAVFERGYLELIGIVDPAAFNPWQRFIARHEGLLMAALRCVDADAAYARLAPRAPFLDTPVARSRNVVCDGSEHTMRFRNIFSRDGECPEARYIVIEHQTPELLWQPQLLRHPNGAVALEEVMVAADDPAVAMRARALDDVVRVAACAELERRFDWRAPAPCLAAIAIAFAELDRTLEWMSGRGIEVRRRGADAWLPPEATNGFVMRLTQYQPQSR